MRDRAELVYIRVMGNMSIFTRKCDILAEMRKLIFRLLSRLALLSETMMVGRQMMVAMNNQQP